MGGHVVVDLRLQFGWRNSPVFWRLMATALGHAHTQSMNEDAVVSLQGAAAVEHVELAPSGGVPVKSLPRDCRPVPGRGGNTATSSWGTTTVCLPRCGSGRMIADACERCSRWRPTIFACWANVVCLTHPSCL